MSRIYHTLSVNHAGEKMTIEAFTKQLNDGTIKTNIVRKHDDIQLKCRKSWVDSSIDCKDGDDHVCTTVCQIYINMLESLAGDPEIIYSRFEEIQKSMKPHAAEKLD
jgi:hypothetical protein